MLMGAPVQPVFAEGADIVTKFISRGNFRVCQLTDFRSAKDQLHTVLETLYCTAQFTYDQWENFCFPDTNKKTVVMTTITVCLTL